MRWNRDERRTSAAMQVIFTKIVWCLIAPMVFGDEAFTEVLGVQKCFVVSEVFNYNTKEKEVK